MNTFTGISFEFHICNTFINLWTKFENVFCLMNWFSFVDTYNKIICNPISFKFHICITFINLSAKFETGFCLINARDTKWYPVKD